MDNTTYAIETKNLEKWYGNVHALRGVNLEVQRGEIFGFLGPNGAGKTTTIRCLLDLIRPQAGSISVLGMNPQEKPVAVRDKVGYLPGELSLEGNMRVKGILRYLGELRGNNLEWSYVSELAERMQLDLTLQVKNLSKGNKQKVGVVQALMHRPGLLIFDEPTSGLDPLIQQEVYRLLKEAKTAGSTIFFSSHIISEVEAIADRVAIIRKGVIVEEAEPGQLVSMEMRRIRVRFKEAIDTKTLGRVEGVSLISEHNGTSVILQVGGEIDGLIKALASYPVYDLDIDRPSLEEIFLAYYESEEKEDN